MDRTPLEHAGIITPWQDKAQGHTVGRKSKLTEAQWADIFARKAEGVSNRALAMQYGISETSIREREAKVGKTVEVQKVARMILETDAALKSLPRTQQITAQNLADKLKSISHSLASAAELGAKTAHRLHALANAEVNKVDDAAPLDNVEALKGVSALTKLANDSSALALGLMSGNKAQPMVDDVPMATLDVTKLSSAARRELLEARATD